MSCASTGRRTRVGRLRSGRAGKANAALYHLTALFRWHASFIEFRPACTHGRSTRTAHTLYPRVPKTAWFSLTDSQSTLKILIPDSGGDFLPLRQSFDF